MHTICTCKMSDTVCVTEFASYVVHRVLQRLLLSYLCYDGMAYHKVLVFIIFK